MWGEHKCRCVFQGREERAPRQIEPPTNIVELQMEQSVYTVKAEESMQEKPKISSLCSGEMDLELIFCMSFNDKVRSRVCVAGEDKSIIHLRIIKEGLVALVHGARDELAGAGRACACTA